MFVQQQKGKAINLRRIVQGMLIGFVLMIILTSVMAFVYTVFDFLNYELVSRVLLIANFLIITYIGFYIAKKVSRNGWLNGGLGGMVYMAVMIIVSYFSLSINWSMILILLLIGLIIGSIGGILGINF